ncbi:flagellin [Desulfospira joergensenii]|uniref:flagellin N-terminal helical domain-containing protein n=1 Tax=Desulfospira joergensenii TaxID=53329 RepID=UPI0003B4AD94|nr:flagellin [Desulfospira joergensenii]
MRVPSISIYKQATYQLGRLTSDLAEANEKGTVRVSSASDDPAGMARILDIDSNLSCLKQIQANVYQGQTVLTGAETTLETMADLMLELNLLCSQLANASATTQARVNAAENMVLYLDQLLDLANTEAYGGYIFAGDDNQAAPFSYDDEDYPLSVTYQGSKDCISLKTGEDTVLSLGCCGCDLFYEDEILVDESNNLIVFQEDPGTGTENILTIEARVPNGTYTREGLAKAVEDAMNEASREDGYGVGYEIGYDETDNNFSIGTDGSYDRVMEIILVAQHTDTVRISGLSVDEGDFPDLEIEITSPSNLTEYTPDPEGSEPLTLTYNSDGTWTVENDPGYGLGSTIEGSGETLEIDVDDDGVADIVLDLNDTPEEGATISFDIVKGYENNSILPDLGFDGDTVSIKPVQSDKAVADTFTVVAGENDAIDFTETLLGENESSTQLTAYIEPGTYSDPANYAEAVEDSLEAASAERGSRVNYEVIYDEENQTFTIQEDTDTGRQLTSFDLLFSSGTNSDTSAAADLGFDARDVDSGPVEGEEATWSIFDTIFDLKTALTESDVDAIQRAMIRLENHYTSLTSSISSIGIAYTNLTAADTSASDNELILTTQRSDVKDADTVEAIMNLKNLETVYEAALSSCSTIMGLSLVDYL